MFLPGLLLWLTQGGWLMLLHLQAGSSFPKPLDKAEEQRLVEAMLAGDRTAANKLIEHNLRLVAHIAKKYARDGGEQEELVSIGTLGLIKAVQSFKPEAGKLTAYASRCIENEMLMYFRSNRKHRNTVLLGDSLGADKDGNEMELSELLGTDPELVSDAAETAIESVRAVRLMGRVLDARERAVVILRCGLKDGEPLPQHEVARRLGISRSYVSRIEKKALQKLRAAMEGTEKRD